MRRADGARRLVRRLPAARRLRRVRRGAGADPSPGCPTRLPFEHAAMVEPLAVAVHAVDRRRPAPDDRVVVIGCGMIGLLTIQVLRARGCRVDRRRRSRCANRRELALQTGRRHGVVADICRVARSRPRVRSRRLPGDRRGGDPLRPQRGRGHAGRQPHARSRAAAAGRRVAARSRSSGSCASSGEYPEALELIASGAVDVAPLISAVAPLADGQSWFDRLHRATKG